MYAVPFAKPKKYTSAHKINNIEIKITFIKYGGLGEYLNRNMMIMYGQTNVM